MRHFTAVVRNTCVLAAAAAVLMGAAGTAAAGLVRPTAAQAADGVSDTGWGAPRTKNLAARTDTGWGAPRTKNLAARIDTGWGAPGRDA
ncbi:MULTISPECIES: hypothetical protein [Streptomyces]|uniref:hypothetical protein n=1 Tax=Streptomyces TaxID=1883 RepID=UPI001674616B|nr:MULTISPECIES: hypothetical protein [Streptomyces]MBD3575325.1 hypothetical protein [Streptomyces sp. KD18]GGS92356.1 hypothetical protein GCM10010286_16400 [Streptomyces toxytricini]